MIFSIIYFLVYLAVALTIFYGVYKSGYYQGRHDVYDGAFEAGQRYAETRAREQSKREYKPHRYNQKSVGGAT